MKITCAQSKNNVSKIRMNGIELHGSITQYILKRYENNLWVILKGIHLLERPRENSYTLIRS